MVHTRRYLARIFLVVVTCSSLSHAVINPVNRSYSVTHYDKFQPSLVLARNYHSARKGAGLFGIGWCTSFESRLIVRNGRYVFVFCGQGRETVLEPIGTKRIVSTFEKVGSQISVRVAQMIYEFDKDLRLTRLSSPTETFSLRYANGKLQTVTNGAVTWSFTYRDSGFVGSVITGGDILNYKYRSGLLVWVGRGSVKQHSYGWDGRLMGEYKGVGLGIVKIGYSNGRVVSYSEGSCQELLANRYHGTKLSLEVVRKCRGLPDLIKFFEHEGDKQFSNFSLTERHGRSTHKRTWSDGLLVKLESFGKKLEYDYDRNRRLMRILSNEMIYEVNEGDRHHVRSFNILANSPRRQNIGKMKLNWLGDQLTGYSVMNQDVSFRASKNNFRVTGQGYDLEASRMGDSILISGQWNSRPLKSFEMDPYGMFLTPEQLGIQARLFSELNMYHSLSEL